MEAIPVLFTIIMGQADKDNKDKNKNNDLDCFNDVSENDNTFTMMPPVASLVMLLLLLVSTEDLKIKKYPISALKTLVPPVRMLQNPLATMMKMNRKRER